MKKWVALLMGVFLLIPSIYTLSILEVIKLRTFDALVPVEQETGNFVILDISEDDLEKEGGWPLPREKLAEIHLKLLEKALLGLVGVFPSLSQTD